MRAKQSISVLHSLHPSRAVSSALPLDNLPHQPSQGNRCGMESPTSQLCKLSKFHETEEALDCDITSLSCQFYLIRSSVPHGNCIVGLEISLSPCALVISMNSNKAGKRTVAERGFKTGDENHNKLMELFYCFQYS